MAKSVKRINLALQGGGAHGAFTWGALDRLLDDERIEIDGISATSAGTMNACSLAYGLTLDGRVGAKTALRRFWEQISRAGKHLSPVQHLPWEKWVHAHHVDQPLLYIIFDAITRMFSPYEFNPMNINPLRDILGDTVDFDVLRSCKRTQLFISATHVQTGKVRIFHTHELSLDVAMASACLPFLFKAVEIDGEHFWDGGYSGNPALFPLIYHTRSQDILIVHVNPMHRPEVPMRAPDIMNRINEISFNSSLLKELRAIAFVQKLLAEGWLKEEKRKQLKNVLMHSLRADEAMREYSVSSKFSSDWEFLRLLHDKGYAEMDRWLEKHFDKLNRTSSVDLREEFLGFDSQHVDHVP